MQSQVPSRERRVPELQDGQEGRWRQGVLGTLKEGLPPHLCSGLSRGMPETSQGAQWWPDELDVG